MSTINNVPGSTVLISELAIRNNPGGVVVDSSRVRGGWRYVDTLADRDQIPADARVLRIMRCYVAETDNTYELRGGITNDHWQVVEEYTPQEIPTNVFSQGGNAFGAPLVLRTTDGQPVRLGVNDYVNLELTNGQTKVSGNITPTGDGIGNVGINGFTWNSGRFGSLLTDKIKIRTTSGLLLESGGGTIMGKWYESGNFFFGPSPVDAGYRLDVNGTSRFTGLATFNVGMRLTQNADWTSYNTSDETTNYERVRQYWNGNQLLIRSEAGGTGIYRTLRYVDFPFVSYAGTGVVFGDGYASGGALNLTLFNNGLSASTGIVQNQISVLPRIAQSGTAGYRAIWVSPYEQVTGSGEKTLLDLGTNSAISGTGTHTSKFKVDNSGNTYLSGALFIGTGAGSLGGDDNCLRPNNPSSFLSLKGGNGKAKITIGNDVISLIGGAGDGIDLRYNSTTNSTTGSIGMKMFGVTGNVAIQTGGAFVDAGYKLDVNGTGRVQGALTVNEANLSHSGGGNPLNLNVGLYMGGSLNVGGASNAFGSGGANVSAQLSINSTTRGFLQPRVTTIQREAFANTTEGLSVYDLTTHLPSFHNGNEWSSLVDEKSNQAITGAKTFTDAAVKNLNVGGPGLGDGIFKVLAGNNSDWFSVQSGIVRFNLSGGQTLIGNGSFSPARFNISAVSDSQPILAIRGAGAGTSDLVRVCSLTQTNGDYLLVKGNGNVLVGNTVDAGFKLDVNGSFRATGVASFQNGAKFAPSNLVEFYNTTDETTNYEKAYLRWNANLFELGVNKSGTGTFRNLSLSANGTAITIGNSGQYVGFVNVARGTASTGYSTFGVSGTYLNNTGTNAGIAVVNTLNLSGNGSYRGVWVSPYEQTVGTDERLLIDLGTNSAAFGGGVHTSVFKVSSEGGTAISLKGAGAFPLKISTENTYTFFALYNNVSATQGMSVGLSGNNTEVWNTQGGAMKFFTGPNAGSAGERLRLENTGQLLLTGSTLGATHANAILELRSDTRGLMLSRITTTKRGEMAATSEGLIHFNSTTKKLEFHNGTSWRAVSDIAA